MFLVRGSGRVVSRLRETPREHFETNMVATSAPGPRACGHHVGFKMRNAARFGPFATALVQASNQIGNVLELPLLRGIRIRRGF